jgi:glycosyltransferase involved in cell wall biosynthesis
MTRVLILANEQVTRRMAGPAIRCFEFARGLSAAGHEVTLASPFPSDLERDGFSITVYGAENIESLARRHDVVVLQGWVLDRYPLLRSCGARLVIDLYDPFPLEELLLVERLPLDAQVAQQRNAVRAVNDQVREGDFFLCASERQRDYWLGWLTAMQRVNPHVYQQDPALRRLIDVVPFGVSDAAPRRSGPAYRGVVPGIDDGDFVLLWGGGVYNWFDPMSLIRGVALAAPRIPRLRLVFMSTGHPNPAIQEMWTLVESRRLAAELSLTDRHVFFNEGWVEYERRADWFLEADVGVSTHFDHVETRFSFRTRILDYFWCGLPVITTAGDTLADAIEARGMGRTVGAEDPEAIAAAIVALAEDDEARAACAQNVRDYAASLTWSRAIVPLLRYCADPRRAADLAVRAVDEEAPAATPDPDPGTGGAPSIARMIAALRRVTPARVRSMPAVRRAAAALRRLERRGSGPPA